MKKKKSQVATNTRGVRNCNPLNIVHGKSKWKGMRDRQTDHRFVQFTDMVYGVRAALKLLRNYIDKGFNTTATIIFRWCPDGTAERYTKFVNEQMAANLDGFDPRNKINKFDYITLYQLMRAMAMMESRYVLTPEMFYKAWWLM